MDQISFSHQYFLAVMLRAILVSYEWQEYYLTHYVYSFLLESMLYFIESLIL